MTPPVTDLAAAVRWLLDHLELIRRHPAGAEAADEISTAVRLVEDVVDSPTHRTVVDVGPCPERDEDGYPCAGPVRAHIPATWKQAAYLACRTCNARWETHQWNRAGRRIQREVALRLMPFVDTAAAAAALGISDRAVRQWITDGWLTNHGTTRQILLDLNELNEAATRRAIARAALRT